MSAAWQPIGTAPTNVPVLLFKAGKQYVGQWVMNPANGHVAWCVAELGGGNRGLLVAPTHWMPLPAPPMEAVHG